MRAGDLRHRVTLQRVATTKDALGGDVQTWSTLATVWAAVKPLSGREAFEAQRVTSTASLFLSIRYREDVTPAMRAVWHGRTFEITHVENVSGRNVELVLWLEEMQAQTGQVA